jgi:hypothetical protein
MRFLAYLAVFLIAGGYAVRLARRGLDAGRAGRAALLLLAWLGLVLPGLVGLAMLSRWTLQTLGWPDPPAARQDLALTTAVVVALVWAARRWPARWGDGWFVATAVAGAVAGKLIYVHLVAVEPVSDFAGMWGLASELAKHGFAYAHTLPDQTWVHLERILLYLLPLRLLFGPQAAAYAIPNVFLGAATALGVYFWTRAWFGLPAARVALVLALAAIEPTLAANLPSHDAPAVACVLLGVAASAWGWRRQASGGLAIPPALAVGVAAILLELQRSTGAVLLLSHALMGILLLAARRVPARNRQRRLVLGGLLLGLVPFVVFGVGNRMLRGLGLKTPADVSAKRLALVTTAFTDSWGDGTYQHGLVNYVAAYSKLDPDWHRLRAVKLASDVYYHPGARFTAFLLKAQRFFDLGSQIDFYLQQARLRWGVERWGTAFPWSFRVQAISRWFGLLFLAALLIALPRLLTRCDVPLLAFLPLVYLSLLSAILLLIGEVQPRYLYPIWYLGAIYIGAALQSAHHRR